MVEATFVMLAFPLLAEANGNGTSRGKVPIEQVASDEKLMRRLRPNRVFSHKKKLFTTRLRGKKIRQSVGDSGWCDWATEDTCYDKDLNFVSCVAYEHGGCPCPAGEFKCDASWDSPGWCTQCFDGDWNIVSCAASAGGDPCKRESLKANSHKVEMND